MQIVGFLAAMLHFDIGGDIIHWAGAIKRTQRDQILNRIGLQAFQRRNHPRRFELEHSKRITACH